MNLNRKHLNIPDGSNYCHPTNDLYRSSAIFYFIYNKDHGVSTSLAIFNYFKVKNNLNVSIKIKLRCLKGKVKVSNEMKFKNSHTIIIDSNALDLNDSHEGSIEIEFFSHLEGFCFLEFLIFQ